MLPLFWMVTEDGQKNDCCHVKQAWLPEVKHGAICEDAYNLGINYLTVYAFSTENWKRPQDEVNALMKLLRQYLKDCIKRSTKNNMCVRVIGDITPLEEDMKQSIKELEEATKR